LGKIEVKFGHNQNLASPKRFNLLRLWESLYTKDF